MSEIWFSCKHKYNYMWVEKQLVLFNNGDYLAILHSFSGIMTSWAALHALGKLKVTLGSCLFLVFLFVELPLVGSKVINLFSNKGYNVCSNLEAVAIELLSRLCVINTVCVFALLPWFPIILASPGVILGLPRVASPVLDVCATGPRWQVVHDPFSLFTSRTTLFPCGETAVVNATSQTLFVW